MNRDGGEEDGSQRQKKEREKQVMREQTDPPEEGALGVQSCRLTLRASGEKGLVE